MYAEMERMNQSTYLNIECVGFGVQRVFGTGICNEGSTH
jgi:hypothetical protein